MNQVVLKGEWTCETERRGKSRNPSWNQSFSFNEDFFNMVYALAGLNPFLEKVVLISPRHRDGPITIHVSNPHGIRSFSL
jgi:hypothetical protein